MHGLCMLPGEIRERVMDLNTRLRQARRTVKAKRRVGAKNMSDDRAC
jgi:hypothetical protein